MWTNKSISAASTTPCSRPVMITNQMVLWLLHAQGSIGNRAWWWYAAKCDDYICALKPCPSDWRIALSWQCSCITCAVHVFSVVPNSIWRIRFTLSHAFTPWHVLILVISIMERRPNAANSTKPLHNWHRYFLARNICLQPWNHQSCSLSPCSFLSWKWTDDCVLHPRAS